MQKTYSTTENSSVNIAATGDTNDDTETTNNDVTSTESTDKPTVRFSDLGLNGSILEKLNRLGFATPTPIQAGAIPLALKGKDITELRKREPAKRSRSACRCCSVSSKIADASGAA